MFTDSKPANAILNITYSIGTIYGYQSAKCGGLAESGAGLTGKSSHGCGDSVKQHGGTLAASLPVALGQKL
jgi:hypothetical protein